jgi:hypothetical protein
MPGTGPGIGSAELGWAAELVAGKGWLVAMGVRLDAAVAVGTAAALTVAVAVAAAVAAALAVAVTAALAVTVGGAAVGFAVALIVGLRRADVGSEQATGETDEASISCPRVALFLA